MEKERDKDENDKDGIVCSSIPSLNPRQDIFKKCHKFCTHSNNNDDKFKHKVINKDHARGISSSRTKIRTRPSTRSIVLSMFVIVLIGCLVNSVYGELGGSITVPVILDRVTSPYFVKDDVIVEASGELIIRAGVKLLFSPTVGITVFGRLIAEGTDSDRIIMSTAQSPPQLPETRLKTYDNQREGVGANNFYSTVQYATVTEKILPLLHDNDNDITNNHNNNNNNNDNNQNNSHDTSNDLLHTKGSIKSINSNSNSTALSNDDDHNHYNNNDHNNSSSTGERRKRADPDISEVPTVRLVEGPSPLMGRLQIYHRGHWRSVCSNSRNWTLVDMQTVCRELGYTGGEYWTWVDHLNDTKQMLWEKPQCQGLERHIKECGNWMGRQLGAGVCDHHPNVGLRCDPYHRFPSRVEHHWRGIRFDNARFRETYTHNNTLRLRESLSSLRFVDILYAGVGASYNASSAIESLGVPPDIQSIRVQHSAYNGVNITNPPGTVAAIRNSTISFNGGFGVYVNSSWSGFEVDACRIESNAADGLRFLFHDAIPDQKLDGMDVFELCTVPITAHQIYPLRLSIEQHQKSTDGSECRKRFSVRSGYVLTMHFPYMMSVAPVGGEMSIYDGPDSRGNLLATIKLRNETWPQSVTSTRESIYIEYKAHPLNELLVFIDLVAGRSKDYDLLVDHSVIALNNGRGVAIENMRSQVLVTYSAIKENSHISGLHILGGVGHVNVSRSDISSNVGDGVNITVAGGARNISRSTIAGNTRRGIAIWFNETSVKLPADQETVLEFSDLSANMDLGLFVGNFCGPAIVNVSGNVLKGGKRPGIEVWSCWRSPESNNNNNNISPPMLKLIIGHNRFLYNEDFGIKLTPLVNARALIEHNYFTGQSKGCLLIKGVDKKELESLSVGIEVSNNVFEKNFGLFVASLGLSHNSPKQKLVFTQNFVRYNIITKSSEGLNPRSRVSAVIVISSANVQVVRNIIQNPESNYEIGSHMVDQSFDLNCTWNWMGHTKESDIYYRVFDRKDRFNLAKISFIPFLLSPTDPNTEIAWRDQQFVPVFDTPEKIIGGEITGRETLVSGEYKVDRDISIRPGGRLQISFGVTLKFLPSVGIMVGGQFHAEGFAHADGSLVKFTLFDTGRLNATDAPVRLVGGRTRKEGRLQVRMGNTWGSVCNYGFDVADAAVACRQMGFVLHTHDWLLERIEIPQASPSEQILMSNVRCTEWDNDLTKCEAEMSEDIENSCQHDNVVGIRCYDNSWAGIRMAISSDKSVMKFAVVEKAGLLDPHTNEHKPAVQMDFSHHVLSDIRVSDNTDDGLGIIYSDLYFPDAVNLIDRSEFSRNLGNGVLLRQLGLTMKDCLIEHNRGAGVLHDPAILRPHQREMAGWITVGKRDKLWYLPSSLADLWLDEHEYKYIVTQTDSKIDETLNIIAKDHSMVISMQLLNPLHNESSEELIIYDKHDVPANTPAGPDLEVWSLRRDQVTFPTVSSSYGVTLWYRSGNKPRGNAILLVRVIRAPAHRYSRSRILEGPLPRLKIHDTKIRYNGRGIGAIHYNRYENEEGDLYLRKANESIEVLRSELSFNQGEAFHVYTPFREIFSSNLSEITFMINSSVITDNSKVIVQYSKDLRSSNNLYHWILRDNLIERNKEGGFQVSLPYVWQYNENHTHSVHFENITTRHNHNFEMLISGHFSKVTIVGSTFEQNVCKLGLLNLAGMEKELIIFNNRFMSNVANFVVQFDTDSQSEILGQVSAYFVRNMVKFNRVIPESQRQGPGQSQGQGHYSQGQRRGYMTAINMRLRMINNATYQPLSYAIGLKGLQKVNITSNLFGENQLDYELLAGIKTAKMDNYVNVVKNWWGSSDPRRIRERIFDFDDWNSYAISMYRPYLLQDNFEAPISTTYEPDNPMTIDNLGGRLMHELTLYNRGRPYIVKSDLTIMPNAMLTIAPGVALEFYPSVGILSLGTLIAQGTAEEPILMRPIELHKMEREMERDRDNSLSTLSKMQRHGDLNMDLGLGSDSSTSVRLCAEGKCDRENNGFLEYFNRTTLQWVPMCDPRFTERNAMVVCRQLDFDHMNIFLDFGPRIEFHYNSLTRIRKWPEPFQCVGEESGLDDCPLRMNGQLYGYDYPCHWNDPFIYISCGERNLNRTMEYWGGVRFAVPDFEQHLFEHRMHDAVTHSSYHKEDSRLEYVQIEGAGILHNEKSPAVLTTMQSPIIRYVNVTKCASHGISIISAPATMRLAYNQLRDNLGLGFTGLSLSGEAQQSDSSSFFPLRQLEIPYGLFGLVDICDTNKEITVEERVLLYYKYDNYPVDCVKIFSSVYHAKNLGFRLLQLNLFNSTGKPWAPDYIKLIDGDIYNTTTEEIATITMDDDPGNSNKFYQSSWPSLSVKLHATGASGAHGFIAEILTLPVSPHGADRNIQHNISYSIFENNTEGAVYYGSAGEISPVVTLERNRFVNNCAALYGNFSSCSSPIRFDVQNMQHIYFKNNIVRGNQGGLRIVSDSSGSATSLKGYVHNNVFERNYNRRVVHVEGKRSSPFQEIVFYRNIVTRNDANFHDVLYLSQVVSNLSENYFHANRGEHIMEVSGFEKVRLPIYQSCTHNSFYNNEAIDREEKTTIIAGSTGQQYVDNIFVNPANSYELVTVNKSRPRAISRYGGYESQSAVDARHNWWGYSENIAVLGRIKDENDNIDLLRVLYTPFRVDNRTLLSGKCPPGYTLVADTCFIYVGGFMNFSEAKDFCKSENASMPYVQSNFYSIINFLRNQQEDYDYWDRIWVQDVDRFGKCTIFVANGVQATECYYRLPFICETDPKVNIDPFAWTSDSVTIGAMVATFVAIVLIIFILVFWYTKSKQRQMERLERRNSIRASIRSSRSFTSMASLSEAGYRRRMAEIVSSQKAAQANGSGGNNLNNYNKMNGSFDSIEKSPSQFNSMDTNSYDLYDTQTHNTGVSSPTSDFEEMGSFSRHPNPLGQGQGGHHRPSHHPHPSSAVHAPHGLPPPPPVSAVNKINVRADVMGMNKPSFDLTFQNANFRETPSMGSIPSGGPTEYWDSSSHLQSNGQAVKYKNTNATNDFHRSGASMATASTFPLQPTSNSSRDDLNNVELGGGGELLTPVSLHHHPLSNNNIAKNNNNNAAAAAALQFSKSYDDLESDRHDPFRQHHHHPEFERGFHRPSLPSYSTDSPTLPAYKKEEQLTKNSNPFKSDPFLVAKEDMDSTTLLPPPTSSASSTAIAPSSSAAVAPPSSSSSFTRPHPSGVIETSLDDLELDYNLDETERPISTYYLETNVDENHHHGGGGGAEQAAALRSVKSQYIPREGQQGHHQRSRSPFHRTADFQALSSRSKSMPLETEM